MSETLHTTEGETLDPPGDPPAAPLAAPPGEASGDVLPAAPAEAPAAVAQPPDPAPAAGLRALLERLEKEPERFSFYAMMRMLEAIYRNRPRFGHSAHPAQDAVRLTQEPTVTHPSSALAAFEPGSEELPDQLRVHFLGLFGTDGPLPLHLTEYARDRRRNHNDPTFQRFADIFHHRAISLFYRAWADVRPTIAFDRPEQDRYAGYIGSLIGIGLDAFRDRDAMPDLTKLHFAGLLANQTRHAEGLAQILSAFFAVPARVEEFHGAWMEFPADDRTRVGDGPRTAELGKTAVLGSRVWSRQHKFRIVIGPLTLQEYHRLLPGGLSFHRLVSIVRNYTGDVMIWDMNLVLKYVEIPPTKLGENGQLGWTTWLNPSRTRLDAANLYLDASADSLAAKFDREAHAK
ncbi:MAG TPA: type VI secretion system baseplate subunit TssG [Rhodopila sp.]|uniref:type VI secretion system baseplate subunit TssG n=1 Tax=Rhodopila sp. TaxID=2480087 RepID=UPI002CE6FE6C|nr:type VI secretion system baseplate subunit TssG [Rhodopila sp.]HVY16868.1 type VI secretion system baseplate subunit TssG [Rhodopila sp.]